jgi:hypothetical protein
MRGKRSSGSLPGEMESLSSLSNLRVFKLHNSSDTGGWFPACVAAWRQLQELHVPKLDIQKKSLQALAAVPSLYTLHCDFTFRGAGVLHLASFST